MSAVHSHLLFRERSPKRKRAVSGEAVQTCAVRRCPRRARDCSPACRDDAVGRAAVQESERFQGVSERSASGQRVLDSRKAVSFTKEKSSNAGGGRDMDRALKIHARLERCAWSTGPVRPECNPVLSEICCWAAGRVPSFSVWKKNKDLQNRIANRRKSEPSSVYTLF